MTDELSLERIMRDPEWIGAPIDDAYWSIDGQTIYYRRKRSGSILSDLHAVSLGEGTDITLGHANLAEADGPPVFDASGKRAAFARGGGIFLREGDSAARLIVRKDNARSLQFSADGSLLSFRVDKAWYVSELTRGVTSRAATLITEPDPDGPKRDALQALQLRTFSTLRRIRDDGAMRRRELALHPAGPALGGPPFHLGEVDIQTTSLSPDAKWMVVVTTPRNANKGREAQIIHFVTESGYEEIESSRTRVGRPTPASQGIRLLNLIDHSVHELDTKTLPGAHDDPLKQVRAENAARHPSICPAAEIAGKPRHVYVVNFDPTAPTREMVWSRDGKALAIQIFSMDSKDRWLASVDFESFTLKCEHRLTDPAWVNYEHFFNEFGFLRDDRTLWFLSEESGYAHLYVKPHDEPATALTHGDFEVYQPAPSPDGHDFYFIANIGAAHSYDVYRVPCAGGNPVQLTFLGGVESFSLDRNGERLLIRHSAANIPSKLSVMDLKQPARARELADTRTAEYRSIAWIEPEIVRIPSSHQSRPIPGKLYRVPATSRKSAPAVLFVHGAGYRQDVKLSFPYYFREQMFHNFLVRKGYVVLVIDYRASQGYGRDWRTAIYRNMGHPELEDLLDAKRWLAEHTDADPERFGIYGGSYGGFMTLMALFRAPGEFKAGAALRPVCDWTQYDQAFTAPILNAPQVDPLAYERSSPIEYASGLRDHLLICHGVIDDHTLFSDTMRLYQRLIELRKDHFSISPYALERHSFEHPESWLDEFKRIHALFERQLEPRARNP